MNFKIGDRASVVSDIKRIDGTKVKIKDRQRPYTTFDYLVENINNPIDTFWVYERELIKADNKEANMFEKDDEIEYVGGSKDCITENLIGKKGKVILPGVVMTRVTWDDGTSTPTNIYTSNLKKREKKVANQTVQDFKEKTLRPALDRAASREGWTAAAKKEIFEAAGLEVANPKIKVAIMTETIVEVDAVSWNTGVRMELQLKPAELNKSELGCCFNEKDTKIVSTTTISKEEVK